MQMSVQPRVYNNCFIIEPQQRLQAKRIPRATQFSMRLLVKRRHPLTDLDLDLYPHFSRWPRDLKTGRVFFLIA